MASLLALVLTAFAVLAPCFTTAVLALALGGAMLAARLGLAVLLAALPHASVPATRISAAAKRAHR